MSLNSQIASFVNWFNNTPWVTSLVVHSGWGCILSLGFSKFFPVANVLVVYTVLAAVKEYYWDKHFESPPQDFKGSSIDFAGWSLGSIIALILERI